MNNLPEKKNEYAEEADAVKIRIPKNKKQKKKRRGVVLAVLISLFVLLALCYTTVVYSNSSFISYWRTIWIETAMTTGRHQWLATALFPAEVVDAVMENQYQKQEIIGGDLTVDTFVNTYDTLPPEEDDKKKDLLNLKNYFVGGEDYVGNTIVINDIENGILVSEIVGPGYKGRIMLVDEPSRVYVGMTQYPGVTGMRILDMMEHYGAIAGVNASGFADYDANGNGGQVVGMSLSQGKYWGTYVNYYSSMVLTTDNRLVVGELGAWEQYGNIRDGIQFTPLLVANGKKMVEGSAGYGIQPRTGIGQREDGVMIFLNVDGRDVTYSIGCTVGDMADILLEYGAINASSCDSGATSVIAYKGEVITKNCSLHPELGRILPNAFLIGPKKK